MTQTYAQRKQVAEEQLQNWLKTLEMLLISISNIVKLICATSREKCGFLFQVEKSLLHLTATTFNCILQPLRNFNYQQPVPFSLINNLAGEYGVVDKSRNCGC